MDLLDDGPYHLLQFGSYWTEEHSCTADPDLASMMMCLTPRNGRIFYPSIVP